MVVSWWWWWWDSVSVQGQNTRKSNPLRLKPHTSLTVVLHANCSVYVSPVITVKSGKLSLHQPYSAILPPKRKSSTKLNAMWVGRWVGEISTKKLGMNFSKENLLQQSCCTSLTGPYLLWNFYRMLPLQRCLDFIYFLYVCLYVVVVFL